MRLRAVLFVALALVMAAPAAPAAAKRGHVKRVAKVRLAAFDNCTELVGWARGQALRTGGGVGVPIRALPPAPAGIAPAPTAKVLAEGVAAPATPTAADQAPGDSFSGTNNQEAAVDESD